MPLDESFRRQLLMFARDQADNIGEFLGEEWDSMVNGIEEFREIDCGGEWVVYVRTFLPAGAAALRLLLTPSPGEILENYLNPKNGRGGSRRGRRARRGWRRGRRGRRRLWFGNGIPDLDEEIARRLPGGRFVRGRRIGLGEHLFWTGIDTADRLLWYWLLWEASETLMTTWTSELIESRECSSELQDIQAAVPFNSPDAGLMIHWWNDTQDILGARRLGITVLENQFTTLEQKPASGELWGDVTFTLKNIFPEDRKGSARYRIWMQATGPDGKDKILQAQEFEETDWPGQEERSISYTARGQFQGMSNFTGRMEILEQTGEMSTGPVNSEGHLSIVGQFDNE